MLIKFGVPILAALALGFGAATTMILKPEDRLTAAPHPPAVTSLAGDTIAGLGELQGRGEPIEIGAPVAGIVRAVHVEVGAVVAKGQPLFTLDEREHRAALSVKRAALASAEARVVRMKSAVRAEDLAPARARVEVAKAEAAHAKETADRAEALWGQQAMSDEEMRSRMFSRRRTEAALEEAKAELARLEAGAWALDVAIAERERDEALADVAAAEMELGRLTVHAPIDAIVLRVGAREGEFVAADGARVPPLVLARSGPLEVRVQVDEEDASGVRAGATAEGFLRGRERTRLDLRFVRIEPSVVPKTSIVGTVTERIDTRVLCVVYEVVGSPERVYPGQRVDVFIRSGTP